MTRATWRILAFGALLGAVALPASAQVVIGGAGTPNVEVNWSVLDNLGRQPNLADMLKSEPMPADTRAAAPANKAKGVQFRPYKPGAAPAAKPLKPAKAQVAAKPKKSAVVPASAKSARMSELVQSAHEPAPVAPAKLPEVKLPEAKAPEPKVTEPKVAEAPVAEVKPVDVPRHSNQPPAPAKAQLPEVPAAPKSVLADSKPAIVGPQIALPEVPKPAAKVELPPTALTPPPLPAAKAPEPVAAPQQLASLPAAPAPALSSRNDTLSVVFASESSHLPESVHADLDRLIKRMQKDDGLGLQLLAFAEGDDANASKARRLSLSRALEVRKYLMEQGLRSTRIEVRALGNKLEGNGPADRVDAVLVSR